MVEPFTAEDKKKIDETLALIKETKGHLARAKLAGLDVSELEERLTQQEAQLMGIRRAYFPTR